MRVSLFSCAISAATPRVAQYQYAPESLDAFKIFSTITLAGRCIQKKRYFRLQMRPLFKNRVLESTLDTVAISCLHSGELASKGDNKGNRNCTGALF